MFRQQTLPLFLFLMSIIVSGSCTTQYSDGSRATSNSSRHTTAYKSRQQSEWKVPHKVSTSSIPPLQNKVNIAQFNSRLFQASERGDISMVVAMIARGANVASANSHGETALHSAAAHNQLETVSLLIEKGSSLNAQTISGWTPLHSAARFGYASVVFLLLENGANVAIKNKDGKTALDLARQASHHDVQRVLLDHNSGR